MLKMKITIISLSIFVIVLPFQNCGKFSTNEGIELSSLNQSFVDIMPPSATPVSAMFKIERSSVRVLPYEVRLAKLKSLIGSTNPALYAQLESRKIDLGSYDFSRGVAQDLTWIDSKITIWAKSLTPFCSSQELRTKFPYPTSAVNFIESALGRSINTEDQTNINEVTALAVSNELKLEVLCYITLSSLEFVAK